MAAKKSSSNMGYAIKPNLPPYPPCRPYPPPPPPGPIPPGLTVQDWMMYINSYIDVRARQLYDKLKELYSKQDEKAKDYVLLKDVETEKIYKVYVKNAELETDEYNPEPEPQPDPREIEIDEVVFDKLNVKDLNLDNEPIQSDFCHFDDLTQENSEQH